VQEPLWSRLSGVGVPLLLVAGSLDPKFVAIHRRMLAQLTSGGAGAAGNSAGGGSAAGAAAAVARPRHALLELPNCGHAVHVEAPLQLLGAVRDFLASLG
jgi:isochorismate synthase/2-succinyl-5-enolpyruvyl-6-hydroxy-3-cyclohexene-1-carboxylate synthase/2-succinyl-6-hydroxy-2,4-cyclohexadiene-1-carboxylate synthase/O-succinylbenzoate synthase